MVNTVDSTDLLQVPIEQSVTPFRLSKYDIVVDHLTRLRIKPPGVEDNRGFNTHAYDAKTNQLQFKLERSTFSMLTCDDRMILSMEEKSFEGYFRIYEGVEHDTESFRVCYRGDWSDAVLSIEFIDRISGDRVRVFTEGHCGDRVALFYMERHKAELPRMVQRENMKRTSCKMIGRIRRPELSDVEYLVATQGVDLTLLLMLWTVRHDIQERRGTLGSVPRITYDYTTE